MTHQKIAIVTGGSRGLGREMAIKIAKSGIDVIITYHSNLAAAKEVEAAIAQAGSKGHALQLDTSDTKSFNDFYVRLSKHLKSEYGTAHFDYLINNAGVGIQQLIAETTEKQFDQMMNIHLKGVYFLTQKALPLMNDGGSIINVSSGLARFTLPTYSAYAIMKGAIEVFTRYLAKELGSRRITANVVAPGAVATDFGGGDNRTNDAKRGMIASATALGRVGEPEDVGGLVAFLCSQDAYWVNGQRIEASGGTLL